MIGFLDACYRPGSSLEWACGLRDSAVGLFAGLDTVTLSGYEVSSDARIVEPWTVNSDSVAELVERGWDHPQGWARTLNGSELGRLFVRASLGAPSPSVAIMGRMPGALTPFGLELIPSTCADALGLIAGVSSDRGLVLAWLTRERIEFSQGARVHWQSVADHLSAAHALRSLGAGCPETTAAVVSASGRILDADDAAAAPSTRFQIADAVKRMDRARIRRRKATEGEVLSLWQALVAGQYSLIESFDRGGQRSILAVRVRSDVRALTARERAIARAAAAGGSNKVIAAELGLSTSTVSIELRRALRKLGCANRTELAGRVCTPYWAPRNTPPTLDDPREFHR